MKKVMLVAAAATFLACVTATFTPTNASPRQLTPRPVEQVEVFTATRPEKPFVEVGVITGEAMQNDKGAQLASVSYVLERVREEAAKAGCDGVILQPGGTGTYQGTCIVYK
jgi:hypothetical protein